MSPIRQRKRDLRTSADLSRGDIQAILDLSREMKDALGRGERRPRLAGKTLAMIFEKPSLRTRCTFEIGMVQLGGHAIYLAPQEIGLGRRESIHDVSRNLERWFDLVIARTFAQATVDELARCCRIPVINALSDREHPCQAMADLLTLTEKIGDLKGFNLTYIGDGNNICHSLMLAGVKMGLNVTVSAPAGYEPLTDVVAATLEAARDCGGSYVMRRLEDVGRISSLFKEVRGRGMMIGLELTDKGPEVGRACEELGLLINVTAGHTLRFLPPLNASRAEVEEAVGIVEQAILKT